MHTPPRKHEGKNNKICKSIYIMARLFMHSTLCFLRILCAFSFFPTNTFSFLRQASLPPERIDEWKARDKQLIVTRRSNVSVSRPFCIFFLFTRIARARRIIAVCIHICICNVCRLYGWVGWYLSGWAGGQHHAGRARILSRK